MCGFVVKVKNAQDAGAIAVIVADNVLGSIRRPDWAAPIRRSRFRPAASRCRRQRDQGACWLTQTVNVTLGLDLSILAGTDRVKGLMMVAALESGGAGLVDLPLGYGGDP